MKSQNQGLQTIGPPSLHFKEEGAGEEKEEETKKNKKRKGEEDQSQASGVGEVGGPEKGDWATRRGLPTYLDAENPPGCSRMGSVGRRMSEGW